MPTLRAVLRLTRIEHSAMLAIAVIAAELIAGFLPSIGVFLLSLATPVLISMGAFAINDYFDIEVDKANKKKRPLVTGEITPMQAVGIATICMVLGVAASVPINIAAFSIALAFALLSVLYAYKLKELLFWGNAYIALAMVIPFIFGNYVVSSTIKSSILLVSLMVFLAGLAREIHGTIRDYYGDVYIRNAHTIPKALGIKNSAVIALALYVVAILISIVLAMYVAPFRYNIVFIPLVAITDILLAYTGIGYIKVIASSQKQRDLFYDKTRNISLAALTIAIIAILLAGALPWLAF